MSKVNRKLICFVGLFIFLTAQNHIKGQTLKVAVEIDFGQNCEKQKYLIEKEKSLTALEAIQLSAKVETKVFQGYVLVTSINDVKSEPGKTAWYYEVNGKNAPVLAINYELKYGDVVVWHFQEDVCTKTVKNQ